MFRADVRAKPTPWWLGPTEWSWGESNPRPSRGHRLRYDHSPFSASWLLLGGVRWRNACHRSFPGVSGLSRRQRSLPAVLHRFCCQAAVDRPRQPRRAARCVTSRPGSGRESNTGIGIAVYLGAPFEESGQLWSHRSASVLGVETSQPRDGSDLNVSDALVKDRRDRSGATAMPFATFPDVGGVDQRVDDLGSRDRWARRRRPPRTRAESRQRRSDRPPVGNGAGVGHGPTLRSGRGGNGNPPRFRACRLTEGPAPGGEPKRRRPLRRPDWSRSHR